MKKSMFDRRQKRAPTIKPRKFMKDKTLSIVRHILTTAGGGMLVSSGYADSTEIPALVGALMTLIGFVWGVLDKRKGGA